MDKKLVMPGVSLCRFNERNMDFVIAWVACKGLDKIYF
jgi:hypothetical protein